MHIPILLQGHNRGQGIWTLKFLILNQAHMPILLVLQDGSFVRICQPLKGGHINGFPQTAPAGYDPTSTESKSVVLAKITPWGYNCRMHVASVYPGLYPVIPITCASPLVRRQKLSFGGLARPWWLDKGIQPLPYLAVIFGNRNDTIRTCIMGATHCFIRLSYVPD